MLGGISTLAMREAARSGIAEAQARLADAADEVATGRHADVGRALGARTAHAIDLRQTIGEIDGIERSNGIAGSRLDATALALGEIGEIADGFFATVVAFRESGGDRGLLVADAAARLDKLTQLLATASNGAHVFGGENTGVPPLADFLADPPMAARLAVQGAFAAEFGFAPSDPQVATISDAQIESFLSGAFAANFSGPGWQANFSAASDVAIRDRIALDEQIETPVSANSPGIRKLVSALVAVVDGGTERLDADAFRSLSDWAASMAAAAAGDIHSSGAIVGISQDRLAEAGERLAAQRGLLERAVGGLENVDATEASMRLNLLTTRLQMSYAATVRLQSLSLLNYL
jgi:flagellar hook-associated protein 3 FlgL